MRLDNNNINFSINLNLNLRTSFIMSAKLDLQNTGYKYDPKMFSEPMLIEETMEHNDSKLDKAEEKRLKWNAYMRKYNERKRQERKERLSKVEIQFKNSIKLYDVNEVNKLINNFIQISESIYNNHIECFDPSMTNEINSNTNDLIKYCDLLQHAIASLL